MVRIFLMFANDAEVVDVADDDDCLDYVDDVLAV